MLSFPDSETTPNGHDGGGHPESVDGNVVNRRAGGYACVFVLQSPVRHVRADDGRRVHVRACAPELHGCVHGRAVPSDAARHR